MFTYLPISIDERVPEGYRLIVAYAKDDMVVVLIEVTEVPKEEHHNCDWEGCSTVSHVVRFGISHKYETESELESKNTNAHLVVHLLEESVQYAEKHKLWKWFHDNEEKIKAIINKFRGK